MKVTLAEYGGRTVPEYDITSGWGCSHWGLTDLYPECEENLRKLLDSGLDFVTTECSCKKESVSAWYSRIDGVIGVTVCQFMDDLWESDDLITDAMWEVCKSEEIPEDVYDSFVEFIRTLAVDAGVDDRADARIELPADATYEDVMDAADRAWGITETKLNEYYKRLKGIVQDALSYPWEYYRNEVSE